MKNNMLKYIILVFGCTVCSLPTYANEDIGTIPLGYSIDYTSFNLFQVDSTVSLRHFLTNQGDDLVRLRVADAIIPIYILQKTDGTLLEYHSKLSIPTLLPDGGDEVASDSVNSDIVPPTNTEPQSVELASNDAYVFVDTLDLGAVEEIADGSYYVTATVTVRYIDNDDALVYHTIQSDQIRLDIRENTTTSNNVSVNPLLAGEILNTTTDSVEDIDVPSNLNVVDSYFDDADISYPHTVVENMLTALVATDIERFYSYFDIERLYRIDSSNNQRYIQASDFEKDVLLEQFLLELFNRPTFINSTLVPARFEIHNTTYNRSNARVDVSMFFIHNGQELTTTTSILLELIGGSWIAIDYIALPER